MSEYAVSLEALHVVDALPAVIFDCDTDSTRERSRSGWMREATAAITFKTHYDAGSYLRFRAGRYPNGEPLILYIYPTHRGGKNVGRDGGFALSDRKGMEEWVKWNICPSAVSRLSLAARGAGFRTGQGSLVLDTTIEGAMETARIFEAMLPRVVEAIHASKPKEHGKCEHGYRVHSRSRWGYKCIDCADIKAALIDAQRVGVEFDSCEHGVSKKTTTTYAWNCQECQVARKRRQYEENRVIYLCPHGVTMRKGATYAHACSACRKARNVERGRRQMERQRASAD